MTAYSRRLQPLTLRPKRARRSRTTMLLPPEAAGPVCRQPFAARVLLKQSEL